MDITITNGKILKIFIIIFFYIFLFNFVHSKDTKELLIYGSDETTIKSFELNNTNIFSSFTAKGSWTDNYGNYGFNKCMGIIDKNLKNVELYFMCEREDKNGFKIWSLNRRKSGIQNSGVGTFEIVDATIPNKDLIIGKKCTYAVKYLRETNFYKSKCKISEELAKVFEEMGLEK